MFDTKSDKPLSFEEREQIVKDLIKGDVRGIYSYFIDALKNGYIGMIDGSEVDEAKFMEHLPLVAGLYALQMVESTCLSECHGVTCRISLRVAFELEELARAVIGIR